MKRLLFSFVVICLATMLSDSFTIVSGYDKNLGNIGTYTVTLTVTDNDGATGTATQTINTMEIFPGATWEFRTPAEVGLDGAKLDIFAANIGGVGCIIKDGYMVKTWGDQFSKADWASASKPVISTLLFFAVHEGLLNSVDALVNDWGWELISKDETMTFRHLANTVSGYGREEPPGAAWAYNDYSIRLYALTMEMVFQQSLDEATLQRLSPLQFEDGSLFTSREGHGLYTTPRDFARIGWFWLNKGSWNGIQILPRSYFDNFMKSGVPGNLPRSISATNDYLGIGTYGGGSDQTPYGPGIYGFNWWFNDMVATSNVLTWPDAPADTFQANGHWGGEVLTVIPSLNMVVAARGNWGSFEPGNASSGINQNLKLLVEAFSGGNVVPIAESQELTTPEDTAVGITLSYTDPDGPGPYTFTILNQPSNGVLSDDYGDNFVTYTPNVGYSGADSFTFIVNDGLDDSNEATVAITVGGEIILLKDTFDRPSNNIVGNGWDEIEQSGATVSISNNKLSFDDTSDIANRPMVSNTFQQVTSGKLIWEFDFDWARTGSERIYQLFMQMGDGELMANTDQDSGVGVNLVWTSIDESHELLGYRQSGVIFPVTTLSGYANVTVMIDLDQYSFEVVINGTVVQSQIPFDNLVDIDTVRFFTDSLNEVNFSGMSFDNVEIRTLNSGLPENVPPTAVISAVPTSGKAPLTVSFDGSGSTDTDGSVAFHAWDFGDGGTANTAAANHDYLEAGTYTVTLTVTDNDGATGTATQTITVNPENVPPTAVISAVPTSGKAPLTVSFDGSGSTDTDGSVAFHAWDFGDGGTANTAAANHDYLEAGTYTVTLTVTDNDGATGTATQTITVSDGSINTITLAATGNQNKNWFFIKLLWNGANSVDIDIFRNDIFFITTRNDGAYTDRIRNDGSGSFTYQICETGTSTCSNKATVIF